MTNLKTYARIFVLVILAALPALLLTVYSAIERRASTESQHARNSDGSSSVAEVALYAAKSAGRDRVVIGPAGKR